MITPQEYENLKDELTGLFTDAVNIKSLKPKTISMLEQRLRKIQEDEFEIVLVGEFQGGKSTTFDALCDGRELSPTGSGIKTSGCIVTAQNMADADEPEKAFVQWRNSNELVDGFNLLLPQLASIDGKRFGGISSLELGTKIDLEKQSDRELILEAVSREWKLWEKAKERYDPEQKGKLDVVRIASIVAHYYDHQHLKELRTQHEFKPEDVGRLVVFPQDWEERWKKRDPAKFDISI